MSIGATEAMQRVAAIQQMASTMTSGVTGGVAAGFDGVLSAASEAAVSTGPTLGAGATSVSATTSSGALTGVPYGAEITAAAQRHGLDPALLAGLVKQESGFNPQARSPAGASGLTQLMPATARSLGVTDATNPAQALEGGAKYLKEQLDRFGGDASLALAAFNAGPGAVQRHNGIPPYAETQAYVKNVLANRDGYAQTAVVAPTLSAASAPLNTSSSSGSYGTSSSLNYPIT